MDNKPAFNGYTFIGMGVTTAICVVGGFVGGHWLDEQLKTGVVFAFVGLAVGIAVAAVAIAAQLKRNL